MAQHRFARSRLAAGAARTTRDGWMPFNQNDVTEIIPLDGFDFDDLADIHDLHDPDFDELEFEVDFATDNETRVLVAPELDDLHAVDDLTPQRLASPLDATDVLARLTVDPGAQPRHYREDGPPIRVPQRGGQHRKQPTSAAKGRLLISAMAAGAAAAAAHTALSHSDTTKTETVLAANASSMAGGSSSNTTRGVQVVAARPAAADVATHKAELAKGVAFAQERAQREARLQQPLYVMPTKGIFTSNFGYRWGVLHAGIDLANSIGTPIYAVSDGVVIDAGPTAGYGMWVKLRHADGTVTLYGHVNTTLVSVGERVMAGDQIATMGNRGFSTGPHLHFEVLLGGSQRVDPVPWLAKRGLSVGNYAG